MNKILASMVIFAAVGVGLAGGQALAAKPATHACLGQSVSQAAGPGFGQFVSNVARNTPQGVGDDVQAVQAGLVSDVEFANTCN